MQFLLAGLSTLPLVPVVVVVDPARPHGLGPGAELPVAAAAVWFGVSSVLVSVLALPSPSPLVLAVVSAAGPWVAAMVR